MLNYYEAIRHTDSHGTYSRTSQAQSKGQDKDRSVLGQSAHHGESPPRLALPPCATKILSKGSLCISRKLSAASTSTADCRSLLAIIGLNSIPGCLIGTASAPALRIQKYRRAISRYS